MTPARTQRRILLVTHSYYEEDPRVRREAEALVTAGLEVDVLGLRRPGVAESEWIDGVLVHRLSVQRHQGAGIATYLREYAAFFALAAAAAARLHVHRRYALAQVATLPDPLVFALAPLRLDGVPIVLDMHEAMPEFFRSRFPAASRAPVRAALLLAERASTAFAGHVLTVNDALAERLTSLGVPRSKVTVILNSPRADRFAPSAHPPRAFMADGCLRLVYAGALTPLYQLDVAVRAVALLVRGGNDTVAAAATASGSPGAGAAAPSPTPSPATAPGSPGAGAAAPSPTPSPATAPGSPGAGAASTSGLGPGPLDVTLDLYGRGDAAPALRALAAELGVADRIHLHGRIPVEEVAARIADADVGLAPTRRDRFTDFSLSTKIFEYAAMRKPVVASRLPTVERYFGPEALCYFEPGDAASLAAAIRRLVADDVTRDRTTELAAARVANLSWEREAARYAELVDRLARR